MTEYSGGALTGLAIFGLRQRGELWEGSVCELLVRPGDRRTAARLLRQIVRAAPLDYLAAVPPAGTGQAPACCRAAGLRPLAGRRPGAGRDPLLRPVRPDPRRRDSWSLSFGDLERLRALLNPRSARIARGDAQRQGAGRRSVARPIRALA